MGDGGIGSDYCKSCVEEFSARGGCPLMNNGEDVDHLVPEDCLVCGQAASSHCQEQGGSKKSSKRRQTKDTGKSGKTSAKTSKRKSRKSRKTSKRGKQSKGRTSRSVRKSRRGKK